MEIDPNTVAAAIGPTSGHCFPQDFFLNLYDPRQSPPEAGKLCLPLGTAAQWGKVLVYRLQSEEPHIARNVTNSSFHQQHRTPTANAEGLDATPDIPSDAPTPRDHVISKEEEAILWRSLAELPTTYREPLVLFYRQHRSAAEVAEVLGLSEDAIHQRLSRPNNVDRAFR